MWVAFALFALVYASDAHAADTPLFASSVPLQVTLDAPLRRIRRDGEEHEGTLSYALEAGAVERLEVRVETRGHSRLEHCRFPPLRVTFASAPVPGVFAGQHKLKLVTQCDSGAKAADHVLLEEWIYRALNLLTPYSFRTRLAQVHYHDSERERDTSEPAFFIEDDGRLAERLGFEHREVKRIESSQIDAHYLALVTLFQFMIGNTDWSVIAGARGGDCCHNGELMGDGGASPLFVIPYDFDQAGLIDVGYAVPYPGLGIRSVRQRVYRGFCATNPLLDAIIAEFRARREAMIEKLNSLTLMDASKRKALKYLEGFFRLVDDPKEIRKQILDKCRG